MISTKKLFWLVLLLVVSLTHAAYADGFKIGEQSVKASGMVNAFTAQADKPSAVYYNPAGITQLNGLQFETGVSAFSSSVTFKSAGTSYWGTNGETTSADDDVILVPHVYATYKLNECWSFGFGEYTNFGLGTTWPDDWEGRYITGGVNAEVKTINLKPVIAYQPLKNLSIAVGADIQNFEVTLEHKILNVDPTNSANVGKDLHAKLNGDSWNTGLNFAVLYWITENLKLGASYQTAIEQEIEGAVDISGTHVYAPLQTSLIGSHDATAKVELPPFFTMGLAWMYEKWTVEFDVEWVGWSTYDKLEVESPTLEAVTQKKISSTKNWEDSWAYKLGAQYGLTETLDLRAGVCYDAATAPLSTLDPLVPSQDRWLMSLGAGIELSNFTIDAAYVLVLDNADEFNNNVGNYAESFGKAYLGNVTGSFDSPKVSVFCLGLTYKL
ncbi:membrane protein involved in aromatic hydrocarbon degradation [Chloroherpeton thalassium ATCC 35110]|uniref:Membrane protein involved in aromatic hydrocarbon degradation n=1 Tax=Chloroherpeton thalassium (strain ATCC 35110 / GB-78) TaxID=517418 RepID=B3QVS5_CHLT3|nr:outer membrane protein transport protein [Chloroherpeton thalassium]ACF13132.1 membrane protein involved in aromatic hydrocarbon degradation [Chloroherpeton thalassium ATCC 35110]